MSNKHEADFEHRVLYEQRALLEEGKHIHSRTYACSYLYPGAISRMTCRARMTVVYDSPGSTSITINGGTIEKWTDQGWVNLEEFFDTELGFIESEEALEYMLNMFKSFTLGISSFSKTYSSSRPPSSPKPPPKKDPFLRVLSFKDKVANDYDKYTKEEKDVDKLDKKDDDTPDFDWI